VAGAGEAGAGNMLKQALPLNPGSYQRHRIHGGDRIWAETNCYVDVWVELLHAWGFEPVAALAFTLAIAFEGDQWTFFKFPHADLDRLYGLDVQELAVWRPLVHHVEEQVSRGHPVLVELDSYYLPDTASTAYQREHVKSTAAIVAIDVAAQQLGYFHNQSYYFLEGKDFAKLFRLNAPEEPVSLPPYVEFVKRRARPPLAGDELVLASLQMLRHQLRWLPESNPFEEFKARLQTDLGWLVDEGIEAFHLYSFTTLRQFGAGFELAATYLQWIQEKTAKPLGEPIAALTNVATNAKTLQFQLARAIDRRKPLDLSTLTDMAIAWRAALGRLKELFL
jgi:Domain of unknown function (DUF1839)